jgi:O-antigen ligase
MMEAGSYLVGDLANRPGDDASGQASVDMGSWLSWGLVVLGACATFAAYRFTNSEEVAIIVGGCFVVPGIAMSPMVGLCLIALSVPLEGLGQLVPGWVTFTRILALITAVVFLPRLFGRSFRQAFFSRTGWWYALLSGWLLLVFPFALMPTPGLIEMTTSLSLLGLVFLVGAIPKDIRQLRMLCLTATFGGALLSLYIAAYGTGAFSVGVDTGTKKFGGDVEHTVGQILAMSLLFSAIVWRNAGKMFRLAILAMDCLVVFGIGMSNSRSTWVGLLATAIFAPLITRRISGKYRMVFIGCAALVGVIGFLMVFGDMFGDTGKLVGERMKSMLGEDRGVGTSGRLEHVWPDYLDFIQGHLLLGGGWGVVYYIGMAGHNDVLSYLAYGGLMGGLLYLGFLVAAFREASRNIDPWFRLVTVSIVITYAVVGIFSHNNISKPLVLMVGVLACMANLGFCPRRGSASDQASLLPYPT